MKLLINKKLWLLSVLSVAILAGCFLTGSRKKIDFSTQVKPILNKKCISCHGGVKKQGGFSVLFREEMFAATKSGKKAVVPGNPGASEMIRRITIADPEERMPYKHEPLSEEEIDILRTWIKQGAKWGDHWAYVPVTAIAVPGIKSEWVKNDIDKFILEKLNEKELKPSQEADKATLLRRVSLDLTGMLPSAAIAEAYLKNKDDKAYETLVDSLLASQRFGERWASMWLDLARYADTKGYEADIGRTIWQYRDWVIRAFNEDMPYTEFITEQIAGDLLPDPTDAQYIATAFHRNSMTNDEGGTSNEEFRVAAVLDRVNTTWTSLMSTTFACVQCHSHPYDPFKHEEYYRFMAYFNNTRDEDVPADYPLLREFKDSTKEKLDAVVNWVRQQSDEDEAKKTALFLKTWQPSVYAELADSLTNAVIGNHNWSLFFQNNAVARLKHVDLENVDQMVYHFRTNKKGGIMKVHLDAPDGPVIASCELESRPEFKRVPLNLAPQKGIHDVYLTYHNASVKNQEEFVVFFDWFAFVKQFPGKGKEGYDKMNRQYWELVNADLPSTPVMMETTRAMHRRSNVFERGAWTAKGKEVEPGVPQSLGFAMPANAPKNRKGLAMWLTDKRNPLVSRTIVNRLWEQLFGNGIVETLEDMGTQGINPTHKELLDYLSWRFMNDDRWSIKKILKEIVMSATYRQDARLTEEIKQQDPDNKYYTRGPRLRLSAEQLRDQGLCISGMMSSKMYGPGVMPWQPEGIWFSPYNGARWQNSTGEDQYRRAVYTYWKRSAPYPSSITFDGVQRVVCTARRIRTNTPLQALTTLNDSAYLDLSRHFAYRMQQEAGEDVKRQISKGYEIMMYKPISQGKLQVLEDLYNKAIVEFRSDDEKTCEMIGMNDEHNNPETAALVVVANAMLNLDEVLTKN